MWPSNTLRLQHILVMITMKSWMWRWQEQCLKYFQLSNVYGSWQRFTKWGGFSLHDQRFPTKMIFLTDVSCNLQPFFAGFHRNDDDFDGKDTLIGIKKWCKLSKNVNLVMIVIIIVLIKSCLSWLMCGNNDGKDYEYDGADDDIGATFSHQWF